MGDANDLLYLWEASRDYDPSPLLERIEAHVLAINSADDERNPLETGLLERAVQRLKHGRMHIIPASEQTRGHATTGNASHWAEALQTLLDDAPRRGAKF